MHYSITDKRYWVKEYGQGPALLLLHGFTGSSRTWQPFINHWKQDFRVLVVDLPGHGNTQVNEPIGMEAFCDDLALLLDKLSVHTAHLVGYSLGGRTALSFAFFYPHRVRSLVLESASPGLETEQQQLARQMKDDALAKRILRQGISSFVKEWEDLPLFESQQKLPAPLREKIRNERLNQSEQGLANSLKGMGTGVQPSWWEKLSAISQPVLLLAGEVDSKFVGIAKRMHDKLNNKILKVIPSTGHAIHVEKPGKFDTIVYDFLKRN
ncbi:2-succinyl-6-hydroxy-2,4-cyclohexadiene-1-carboxylate synthase [Sediminibacillus albus]|nr:2-succinyl-6-hydroxy-2,4-cyclohexadiene-1-carboxylate synthase [Sediminibacillus albus]